MCAGLVLLAKPTAPCAIASRTIACICAISSAVAARLRGVVAHDVGAHRRVADVGGDVGDRAARAQLRQVLGEGLEAPVDAGAQRVDRHALDLRQVAHRDARGRPAGTGAIVKPQLPITAVVTPSAGDGRQRRVPGDLRVEVGVAVDDAGHQREAVGVDGARCASDVELRADADDAAGVDRDVAAHRLGAAAVDDEGVAEDEVDHAVFRRSARANSDSISRRILYAVGRRVHRDVGPASGSAPSSPARSTLTSCARPSGRPPMRAERLRPAAACPTPCSRLRRRACSPGCRSRLAVATTSAFQHGRDAGRLAAQRDARHRHADLEADQVPALVEREVAAARVGVGVVFLEAVA